ncbi:hypothetical protein [Paenibacillus donghaensis]|uniref:Uncharacterized protein n=1 Tax=Paenibacillus donghaensis TaxID=414771 RepID=A0A2Z2KFU8_9BACL|nr:hypothetical protein [Paenibacillus donghaensis]ASA21019.1 hypothetical protein B9T62_09610 [Paenibacillus donghaensis]
MRKRMKHWHNIVRKHVWCSACGICCLLSICAGCSAGMDKPAAEDLNLVLAGMAGSDAVSFEGAAALLRGGKPLADSILYYGGNVEDHNKVSLYTLLPDRPPLGDTEMEPVSRPGGTAIAEQPDTTAADASADVKRPAERALRSPTYYSRLEKQAGVWQPQANALVSQQQGNPLPALNPLRQLEELEDAPKQVTEERGAARGTRMLRIRVTPAEAKRRLAAELEQEMLAARPATAESAEQLTPQEQRVNAALEKLWQKRHKELLQKLNQAEVEAVYHLTVDTKRNLPKRLTWNRKVSSTGAMGQADSETYVVEVDFYGYR